VILTRMDGDARGGAALSMRAVTGKPIKFAGVGEGLDKLEAFHPDRVAGRILGMGDVVSLVERAAETIKVEEAEKLAAKMAKGKFDLDDLWAQFRQMQRMGGLGALAGMMPGLKGMKGAMDQAQNSKALVHMEAMLSSMTAKERSRPEIINAKRKIRIAKGSGTTVQEVNKLLKMHLEMSTAMKRLKKMGGLGKLAAMFNKGGLEGALGGLAPGGALPPGSMPALGGGGLPGLGGGAPFNLPPGFNKFSKK
jgi:signal recognition particle subunit SRP54